MKSVDFFSVEGFFVKALHVLFSKNFWVSLLGSTFLKKVLPNKTKTFPKYFLDGAGFPKKIYEKSKPQKDVGKMTGNFQYFPFYYCFFPIIVIKYNKIESHCLFRGRKVVGVTGFSCSN